MKPSCHLCEKKNESLKPEADFPGPLARILKSPHSRDRLKFFDLIAKDVTSNPSNNAMNYVKFTVLMVINMALKQYLKDQKIFPQNAYLKGLCIYSIASVAIMAGGAIRDAVAFIGSNYLACFLSTYSSKAPFEGKKKT